MLLVGTSFSELSASFTSSGTLRTVPGNTSTYSLPWQSPVSDLKPFIFLHGSDQYLL